MAVTGTVKNKAGKLTANAAADIKPAVIDQASPKPFRAWPVWMTDKKFVRKLLRSRFFRRIFGFIGPKYIIYEINGCKYCCNLLDHMGVGHYFLKNDHYEPYITELMIKYTNSTGDVLDIGGNIGYFSVLCSQKTKGKIYSIEPEEANYLNLLENIRLNQSINVLPLNFAVGNANGNIDLYINKKNKGDHRCSEFTENLSKVTRVDLKRIDNFLTKEEFDRIRLIKMDVQGYEMKVCEGMTEYLAKASNLKIISELEANFLLQAGNRADQYLRFMQDNGFKISIVDEENRRLIPSSVDQVVSWSQKYANSNILFEK